MTSQSGMFFVQNVKKKFKEEIFMPIKLIKLKNFTVFKDFQLNLSPNINIFVGENGTGKTHLLKAIYSACEVSKYKKTQNIAQTVLQYFNEKQNYANLLHDKNIPELKISTVPQNEIFSATFIPCKDMLTHSN